MEREKRGEGREREREREIKFNGYAVIPPTPHYSVNEVDIVVYLGSSILIFPFTTRRLFVSIFVWYFHVSFVYN